MIKFCSSKVDLFMKIYWIKRVFQCTNLQERIWEKKLKDALASFCSSVERDEDRGKNGAKKHATRRKNSFFTRGLFRRTFFEEQKSLIKQGIKPIYIFTTAYLDICHKSYFIKISFKKYITKTPAVCRQKTLSHI